MRFRARVSGCQGLGFRAQDGEDDDDDHHQQQHLHRIYGM